MPILPFLPLIGAAVKGIGDIIGTNQANKANMAIMQQQRNWAVEDWNKTNAYNAPAAQMQRFKDAGLNPHLIYGQSNTAPAVRSSSSAEMKAPDYGGIGTAMTQGLFGYFDLRRKELENDKLEKYIKLIEAQERNQRANADYKNYQTQFGYDSYSYDLGRLDWQNTLLAKKTLTQDRINDNLLKTGANIEANTKYTLDNNERMQARQALTLIQAAENILKTRAETSKIGVQKMLYQQQILNLKETLKQLQYETGLNVNGLSKKDSAWWRILDVLVNRNAFNQENPEIRSIKKWNPVSVYEK